METKVRQYSEKLVQRRNQKDKVLCLFCFQLMSADKSFELISTAALGICCCYNELVSSGTSVKEKQLLHIILF